MKRWTLLEVLDWTREYFASRGIENPRRDAELILSEVLKLERVMLYARHDQPLTESERATVRELVARRAKHEPMAYLLKSREFWSLDLKVTPSVLIPRPDTETLVERALAHLAPEVDGLIVDVGTGSGAIALSLAKERPKADVLALDLSEAALEVAKANATALDLPIRCLRSDLLSALAAAPAPILIAANLPYIPSGDIAGLMPDVRDYEPRLALDGGDDGLGPIRRLIPQAFSRLQPGGWLVLEAGYDQLDAVRELMAEAGFVQLRITKDAGQNPRVAEGQRPL